MTIWGWISSAEDILKEHFHLPTPKIKCPVSNISINQLQDIDSRIDTNKYFVLLSSSIVVRGANRSLIQNVDSGLFDLIPTVLADIIDQAKSRSIGDICDSYGYGNKKTILSYFSFLISKNYGYLFASPEGLLNQANKEKWNEWNYPYQLTSNWFLNKNIEN